MTAQTGAIALALVAAACGQTGNPAAGGAPDATADGTSQDDSGSDAGADAAPIDAGPPILGFGMKKMFVGDTDVNGVKSAAAWKAFGDNIDGLVTTSASTDVCKLVAGAPPSAQADGDNGIDNSFGKNILPIIQTFITGYGEKVNQALTASTFNILTRTDAPAALYGGGPTLQPLFDGTDRWPITFESVDKGDVHMPKVTFPAAALTGQSWSSGDASGQGVLALPILLGFSAPLKVNKLHVRMTMSADGKSATQGIISGVLPTADFIATFRQIAPTISSSLCSSSALDSITQQLAQASDILADGTQDPNKPCDGISFGFGFDASVMKLGPVAAPVNPPANLCE